jgi:hypothetical protein
LAVEFVAAGPTDSTSRDVLFSAAPAASDYASTKRMKTLICPNCGTDIPLEEAVTHQIREELQLEFQAESTKREKALVARETKLATLQAELSKGKETLEQEIEGRVNARSAEVRQQAQKQAQDVLGLQLQDLRTQLGEKDQKLAEAMKAELDLRKKQRELESRQQALELEVTRRIDEEREAIRREARASATEEGRLRVSEKDKLISNLQTEICILKQKAEQGSQQLQGEVLEIELESLLRQQFPSDEIVPVKKGTRGADLSQLVMTPAQTKCGTIVWETKRTRNWSQSWIPKLKEDQRAQAAELAVLVTESLPNGTKAFDFIDGVWVTTPSCAIALATALRYGLLSVANERLATNGKSSKMERLYDYLAGTEFRQKIEAIVEALLAMQNDLETEKRAFTKIWARRGKQIEQVASNAALLYGGIQGIVGQSALPEIASLGLPEFSANLAD